MAEDAARLRLAAQQAAAAVAAAAEAGGIAPVVPTYGVPVLEANDAAENTMMVSVVLQCCMCSHAEYTELLRCTGCFLVAVCSRRFRTASRCGASYAATLGGEIVDDPTANPPVLTFLCGPCVKKRFSETVRVAREAMQESLSKNHVADMMQGLTPWFYTIMHAEKRDKVDAYARLKRYAVSQHQEWASLTKMTAADVNQVLKMQALGGDPNQDAGTRAAAKAAAARSRQQFAPHRKWKDQLIPSRGGGYDVCLAYLRLVVANESVELVRAMALERIFILERLERHFTDAPKGKSKNPAPPTMTLEGILRCLTIFQALARDIKNPSCESQLDAIFSHVYGPWTPFLRMRESVLYAFQDPTLMLRPHRGPGSASSTLAFDGGSGRSRKRPAPTTGGSSSGLAQPPADVGGKKSNRKVVLRRADQVEEDKKKGGKGDGKAKGFPCPNCKLAGREEAFHSVTQCRELGNAAAMKCQLCNEPHWHEDCPRPDDLKQRLESRKRQADAARAKKKGS